MGLQRGTLHVEWCSAMTMIRLFPSWEVSTPCLNMASVRAGPPWSNCSSFCLSAGQEVFHYPPAPCPVLVNGCACILPIPCSSSSLKPQQCEKHGDISSFSSSFLRFLHSRYSVSLQIRKKTFRKLTLKPIRLVNVS